MGLGTWVRAGQGWWTIALILQGSVVTLFQEGESGEAAGWVDSPGWVFRR